MLYGYSLDDVEILTDQEKSEIITIVLVDIESLWYLIDCKKDKLISAHSVIIVVLKGRELSHGFKIIDGDPIP